MDNRHLSKAIRTDNKEWITGYYLLYEGKHWIFNEDMEHSYVVDPETVCKHTGHPNNLFEGDEVKSDYGAYGFVMWNEDECQYVIQLEFFNQIDIPLFKTDDWKPTGRNIHDLPKEAAKHFDSIEVSQDVNNQVDKTIEKLEGGKK